VINETPNKKHGKSSLQNDYENGVGENGFSSGNAGIRRSGN